MKLRELRQIRSYQDHAGWGELHPNVPNPSQVVWWQRPKKNQPKKSPNNPPKQTSPSPQHVSIILSFHGLWEQLLSGICRMHHVLIPLPLTPQLSWIKSSRSFWGEWLGFSVTSGTRQHMGFSVIAVKNKGCARQKSSAIVLHLPESWEGSRSTAVKDQSAVTSTICELSTSRSCCLGCGTEVQILDWPRKARNALRRGPGCSQVGPASRNSEPQKVA